MSRRMIDPQAIIKSQVINDKMVVDLNEILENHGVQFGSNKTITLQIYSKKAIDDNYMAIDSDTGIKAAIIINTAITITKSSRGDVIIRGLLVDNLNDMNFLSYIEIPDGDYENGIILTDYYRFDVHVIKV